MDCYHQERVDYLPEQVGHPVHLEVRHRRHPEDYPE